VNTCYMNATVQCLQAIPELRDSLKSIPAGLSEDVSTSLAVTLRDLFQNLQISHNAVRPVNFLTVMRLAFPQFAQVSPSGIPMQQDAEECYVQLLNSLNSKLPLDKLFGGETSVNTKCEESDSEEPKTAIEKFRKLSCHISKDTTQLLDGLKEAFSEDLTFRSPTLNREAKYKKTSLISKLPFYLTVHFVRFFWKSDIQKKAKICKPVAFPFNLDIYDLCTPELKNKLLPKRKRMSEATPKELKAASSSASSNQISENDTGMYELLAILSHKGRDAESGHYVAWIRKGSGSEDWYKFDDEQVTVVDYRQIESLSGKGGADSHIAYLCIYGTRRLDL